MSPNPTADGTDTVYQLCEVVIQKCAGPHHDIDTWSQLSANQSRRNGCLLDRQADPTYTVAIASRNPTPIQPPA